MSEPTRLPEGAQVADAKPGNWVDRWAPAATRPYLRLSRADRPIGTWLLFVPCLWGIALAALTSGFTRWDAWLVLACGLGSFLMRGAGCTWNDITDRHIDAEVARTRSRPLPSGQVTPRAALVWMVAQAAVAALILFTFNGFSIWLGIGSLALVAIYPFAKRFTWWPQAFLGLAFNWGALMGYAAHAGHLTWGAGLLYAAGISWTLYYDTIYAHQDKEDDELIGVKSTARLFGDDSRFWLWGFGALTVILATLAVAFCATEARDLSSFVISLVGTWAMGWHLALQMFRLNLDDPASCLKVFRANRDTGLIFALFLAIAAAV